MTGNVAIALGRLENVRHIVPTNAVSQAGIRKAKYECWVVILEHSNLEYGIYQEYRRMLELALGEYAQ